MLSYPTDKAKSSIRLGPPTLLRNVAKRGGANEVARRRGLDYLTARNRGPAVSHFFGRVALPFHGGDGHVPATPLGLACLACLLTAVAAASPKASLKKADVPKCVKELGDLRFAVREKASARLLAIGPEALPALEEATKGTDPEICQRAWRIIDQWAAEGKVPALLFQLGSRSEPVRAGAAYALGRLAPPPRARSRACPGRDGSI